MLTNLDKVLWPATGFTKGGLIAYYRDVAPVLLPHLAGRPLSCTCSTRLSSTRTR